MYMMRFAQYCSEVGVEVLIFSKGHFIKSDSKDGFNV